jgi:hypothetical protein
MMACGSGARQLHKAFVNGSAELLPGDVEDRKDSPDRCERHVSLSALDTTDICAVKASEIGEPLLRELLTLAEGTEHGAKHLKVWPGASHGGKLPR